MIKDPRLTAPAREGERQAPRTGEDSPLGAVVLRSGCHQQTLWVSSSGLPLPCWYAYSTPIWKPQVRGVWAALLSQLLIVQGHVKEDRNEFRRVEGDSRCGTEFVPFHLILITLWNECPRHPRLADGHKETGEGKLCGQGLGLNRPRPRLIP